MKFRLIVSTDAGDWVYYVFVFVEEMKRVCAKKGWECDWGDPEIHGSASWQALIFDAAKTHALSAAGAEGKSGVLWKVHAPPPLVRLPKASELIEADMVTEAFALKLVSRPR